MERATKTKEPVAITAKVADGLEFVRRSGVTNMLDRPAVIDAAIAFGFDETADWIEANRDAYSRLIFSGFTVTEEED